MNLRLVCAFLLGLGLVVGAPAGFAAKKDKNEVAVTVDPTFFDHTLNSIGVLEMLTPSVEDERVEMVQDLVEGELQEKGEFTILFPEDLKAAAAASAARDAGVKEAYGTLLRVWEQRRVIDPPSMEIVAAALGLDALVGIEVTHWEQYQLDLATEGNSTTTVGLKVSMFSRDRTLLWEAARVYVAKSPPYNPSNSVVADADGGARAAGKSSAPAPPEYDDTAERVVKQVMATWPTRKGKDAKEKS